MGESTSTRNTEGKSFRPRTEVIYSNGAHTGRKALHRWAARRAVEMIQERGGYDALKREDVDRWVSRGYGWATTPDVVREKMEELRSLVAKAGMESDDIAIRHLGRWVCLRQAELLRYLRAATEDASVAARADLRNRYQVVPGVSATLDGVRVRERVDDGLMAFRRTLQAFLPEESELVEGQWRKTYLRVLGEELLASLLGDGGVTK